MYLQNLKGKEKTNFVDVLKVTDENSMIRIRIRIRIGSISQMYGSRIWIHNKIS
jgi:hypothetical protein